MSPCRILKWLPAGTAAAFALHTPSLLACAACYGQSDSPLAQGMNWGIFSLLGVIGAVLAGVAVFFVHIGRRSAAVGRSEAAPVEDPKEN